MARLVMPLLKHRRAGELAHHGDLVGAGQLWLAPAPGEVVVGHANISAEPLGYLLHLVERKSLAGGADGFLGDMQLAVAPSDRDVELVPVAIVPTTAQPKGIGTEIAQVAHLTAQDLLGVVHPMLEHRKLLPLPQP